ncbi:hypothetical protein D9757_010524 [Collybiopsis confluens]|uniref:Cytochrome P450 n=1 Tax=Collybiopsis confluens TaxID=2823264 RepID=A0A8H5GNF8_9AGAR|nr:hypothetical protein D9757_010524 [Collybiopsis confluens]
MISQSALLAFILTSLVLVRYYYQGWVLKRKLATIPSCAGNGVFSSFTDPFRPLFDPLAFIQEGYDKFRGSVFKFQVLSRWVVIVTSPALIQDLQKAPDDVVSSQEGVKELLQSEYTFGNPFHEDPYTVKVIRGLLTRNIGAKFAEVQDEITVSCEELLPSTGEWELVNLRDVIMPLVARTSNRFFSGLPLCRNPDYLDLNIRYTLQVILSAYFISVFPAFLKPLIGNVFTPLRSAMRRARRHLVPIIKERLANEERYGEEWSERPNDLLTWLLSEATTSSRRTVDDLVLRFLATNFGAIHTTTMTVTAAISSLGVNPEYIPELRQEITSVVAEHGWTKAAMGHMRKLDSFLMESQRMYMYFAYGLNRKVLKDFTFLNGLTVPAGATVAVPVWAIHHDNASTSSFHFILSFMTRNEYFPNAETFDGFRFSKMREEEGESIKHQMVTPTREYLLFGVGRHACPGRFFAVNEVKAIIGHMLMEYDFKLEPEGVMPNVKWFGGGGMQDEKTKVWFRKRK